MSNILLLAMSTFPNNGLESHDFDVEFEKGKVKIVDCIGQLEPVTKYMISRLSDQPLEIVMLCSPETKRKSTEGDYKGESPVGFFESQIHEYTEAERYQAPKFHIVDINADNPYSGIIDAVEVIREIKKTGNFSGEFWIDSHGGFRDVAQIMQAIVSLLKVDGIIPSEILGVRFDHSAKKYSVVRQRNAFDFFDFVTGMNDFINFGNADVLKEYFSSGSEEEKGIVEAIDKIAQGTQLCYPLLYKQGLNSLGKELRSAAIRKDSLLALFRDYIESSYGSLLRSDTRTTLQIVKHCYEKKLYQQALTFIESDMPKEIIDRGIIIFGEENYTQEAIVEEAKTKKTDLKHFIFDTYLILGDVFYSTQKEYRHDHEWAIRLFSGEKDFFQGALTHPCDFRNKMKSYINTDAGNNQLPFDLKPSKKDYRIAKISSMYTEEYYDLIGFFLRMHRALKAVRNLFNHADEKNRNIEGIVDTIGLYIDYASYLYSIKK